MLLQLQTTWLIQATYMKLEFHSFTVPPASIFSFDIIWVLVITPIVGQVVYPLLKSCGISFTSLRRIGVGMLFAAASMIVAGLVEIIRRREVEEGHFFDQVVFGKHRQASNLNVFWQIPQFLIMGCAEVLAVTTGRHTLLLIIIIIIIIIYIYIYIFFYSGLLNCGLFKALTFVATSWKKRKCKTKK